MRAPLRQQAVQEKLEELTRRAARPALGPVAPNTESVVFENMAELLACLAEDWLADLAHARWWWADLLKSADSGASVISLWSQSTPCVPAALDRMLRNGSAAAFITRLPAADLETLYISLVETFDLFAVRAVLDGLRNFRAMEEITDPEPLGIPLPAPWSGSVSAKELSTLTIQQRLALGIAVTLAREPSRARTRLFAAEIEQWIQLSQTRPAADSENGPTVHNPAMLPVGSTQVVATQSRVAPDPERSLDWLDGEVHSPQVRVFAGKADLAALTPEPEQERSAIEQQAFPGAERDEDCLILSPYVVGPQLSAGVAPVPAPAVSDDPINEYEEFETEIGGIFYLINVAIHLNLYSDFTMPTAAGIDLSIWDFLAVLGSELLGQPKPEDAVWRYLAGLAGRDRADPPCAGFEPPDGLSLEQWTDRTCTEIRERLKDALGIESPDEAAAFLILQRARVRFDPFRIDVLFRLEEHPIEIRRAGLDRNPAWVPAAGRVVEFHYE